MHMWLVHFTGMSRLLLETCLVGSVKSLFRDDKNLKRNEKIHTNFKRRTDGIQQEMNEKHLDEFLPKFTKKNLVETRRRIKRTPLCTNVKGTRATIRWLR